MEIWKPVPVQEFAHAYEVSSHGNVRRIGNIENAKPMRTGSKRPGAQRSKARFSTKPRCDVEIGALVLEAFVSVRPQGAVVMHLNDDTADNRIGNVKWGTLSDNARDCARKGRVGGQKLSAEDVATIRAARASGVRGAVLAARYRVSQQRICDVYKGRTTL